MPLRRSVAVLGLKLTRLSLDEALDEIHKPPGAGPALVVTPNLNHLRLLRGTVFRKAYDFATLTLADGFPVWLYAKAWGASRLERVTGCDLCARVMNDQSLRGKGLFFVVESDATAAALACWADEQNARIGVYVAPPGFDCDTGAQAAVTLGVRAFAPAVLLVTLGAPTSESFVYRARGDLPACWALCVGQAVRVVLGETLRAPPLMRWAGAEWLWRIGSEPGRLAGRYLRDAAFFPLAVLRDLWARVDGTT